VFHNALLAPPDEHLIRRALINFVLCIFGSPALFYIINIVTMMAEIPKHKILNLGFIIFVFVVPLVKTLILVGLLALTPRRWSIVPWAIISATLWGGLHAFVYYDLLWFSSTFLSFFVFSCGYLVWRQKSFIHGFAAAILPHVLLNALFATLGPTVFRL